MVNTIFITIHVQQYLSDKDMIDITISYRCNLCNILWMTIRYYTYLDMNINHGQTNIHVAHKTIVHLKGH